MIKTVEALSYTPISGTHGTTIRVTIDALGVRPNSLMSSGCLFGSEDTGAGLLTSQVQIDDSQTYSIFSVIVPLLPEGEYMFAITLSPAPGTTGDSYIIKSGFPFIYRNQPAVPPIITRIIPSTIRADQAVNTVYNLSGKSLENMDVARFKLIPGNHTMTVLVNTYQNAKVRFSGSVTALAPGTYTVSAFDKAGSRITSQARLTIE